MILQPSRPPEAYIYPSGSPGLVTQSCYGSSLSSTSLKSSKNDQFIKAVFVTCSNNWRIFLRQPIVKPQLPKWRHWFFSLSRGFKVSSPYYLPFLNSLCIHMYMQKYREEPNFSVLNQNLQIYIQTNTHLRNFQYFNSVCLQYVLLRVEELLMLKPVRLTTLKKPHQSLKNA